MEGEIVIDNVEYISTKTFAKLMGFSRGYISTLCSKGWLSKDSLRVGQRKWYIKKTAITEMIRKENEDASRPSKTLSRKLFQI